MSRPHGGDGIGCGFMALCWDVIVLCGDLRCFFMLWVGSLMLCGGFMLVCGDMVAGM